MVAGLEVLAIIPARGGSKGIPRKNVKLFAGFPLIAYSIAAAKQSRYVTRVIVSTDDKEIAAVAREWGAETPFLRPAEFAQDQTLDLPVFQHAVRWLKENEGYQPDIVIQLRPTSPFRPTGMLDEAVQLLIDHPEADSVRGVVPSSENPHKMWRIDTKSGRMTGLLQVDGIDEPYNAPRQALPPTYWQTGHIDAIRPDRTFMRGDSMSGNVILPLMIDPQYTVDIDTPADWAHYERIAPTLDIARPGRGKRALPCKVRLLALDFDGVMTDDRVYLDQNGVETVACHRGDGMGIAMLKKADITVIVISSETNPVVARRCEKLKIEAFQGLSDKPSVFKKYCEKHGVQPEETVFIGNDVNDLSAFDAAGFAMAPADAHPLVLEKADFVLTKRGGKGAVREACELLLNNEMENNGKGN